MKRCTLSPGHKSLARGSTFASLGSGLRRSRPKPVANPHLAALRHRLAFLFHDAAQHPTCRACHEPAAYLHAHHAIARDFLETELQALVTPERMIGIVYDGRNALGLCPRCHNAHHGPSLRSPVSREILPASAWEFGRELDHFTGTAKFSVRLEAYPTGRHT